MRTDSAKGKNIGAGKAAGALIYAPLNFKRGIGRGEPAPLVIKNVLEEEKGGYAFKGKKLCA